MMGYQTFSGRKLPGPALMPVGALPPASTPEGLAALALLGQRKIAAARKSQRIARLFGVACTVALPVSIHLVGVQLWTYLIPFGMLFMLETLKPKMLTEREYYSIPGARSEGGEHQCVYCGNAEVEIEYYQPSIVSAVNCAYCEKRLFEA